MSARAGRDQGALSESGEWASQRPEANAQEHEPFRSPFGDRQVIRVGVLILREWMEQSVIAHLARTPASTNTRRLQRIEGRSPNMHRGPLSFCRAILEEELPWGMCHLRVIKVSPQLTTAPLNANATLLSELGFG